MNWLLRAVMWARNPPSWGRVRLVLAVVAIAAAIFAAERAGLWPDWATLERPRPGIGRVIQP